MSSYLLNPNLLLVLLAIILCVKYFSQFSTWVYKLNNYITYKFPHFKNNFFYKVIKEIYRSLSYIQRYLQKRTITFRLGNQFYKFYFWDNNNLARTEHLASVSTKRVKTWDKLEIITNENRISFWNFKINTSSFHELNWRLLNTKEILELEQVLIHNTSTLEAHESWLFAFPHEVQNILKSEYLVEEFKTIDKELSKTQLPNSGCHGDLLPRNVYLNANDKLTIIDWELFRDTGTFYEDISTLIVGNARTCTTPGDDIMSVNSNALFSKAMTPILILILYSINRLIVELNIEKKHPKHLATSFSKRVMAIKSKNYDEK